MSIVSKLLKISKHIKYAGKDVFLSRSDINRIETQIKSYLLNNLGYDEEASEIIEVEKNLSDDQINDSSIYIENFPLVNERGIEANQPENIKVYINDERIPVDNVNPDNGEIELSVAIHKIDEETGEEEIQDTIPEDANVRVEYKYKKTIEPPEIDIGKIFGKILATILEALYNYQRSLTQNLGDLFEEVRDMSSIDSPYFSIRTGSQSGLDITYYEDQIKQILRPYVNEMDLSAEAIAVFERGDYDKELAHNLIEDIIQKVADVLQSRTPAKTNISGIYNKIQRDLTENLRKKLKS